MGKGNKRVNETNRYAKEIGKEIGQIFEACLLVTKEGTKEQNLVRSL